MPQFKHTITQFLRFPPKFRRPLSKQSGVNVPADTTVAHAESNLQSRGVRPVPGSALQPLVDAEAGEVEKEWSVDEDKASVREQEESDGESEDIVSGSEEGEFDSEHNVAAEVNTQDAEVEDTPKVFPFELVRKTRMEMMVHRLYVALSDNDHEITALRTRDCEPFTHVVRIAFEPPSNSTLSPSSWSMCLTFPTDGPFELRLTCPAFVRVSEDECVLTAQQLHLACKYIAFSLPYRRDEWDQEGIRFPFSVDDCRNARLLVAGPTDRSVDVMAILVGYLTFLTGASATMLLRSVQKFDFTHQHWRACVQRHAGRAAAAIH